MSLRLIVLLSVFCVCTISHASKITALIRQSLNDGAVAGVVGTGIGILKGRHFLRGPTKDFDWIDEAKRASTKGNGNYRIKGATNKDLINLASEVCVVGAALGGAAGNARGGYRAIRNPSGFVRGLVRFGSGGVAGSVMGAAAGGLVFGAVVVWGFGIEVATRILQVRHK